MNSEEVMSVDVAIYLGLCVLMTLCLCGQYRLQLLFMLRLKSHFSHIPPQCPSKSQMLAWGAVLLFADISNFAFYLFIAHYLVAVSYEAAVNFCVRARRTGNFCASMWGGRVVYYACQP